MPLVDSLLTAVVRSDGDALVLHVGEKPYVVAAAGPVELSRQGLGLGAMEGMLAQLLTADSLRSLREMGAVEHELDARPAAGGDRFTVVAARGGDDIWIELRRHRRTAVAAEVPPARPKLDTLETSGPAVESAPKPVALPAPPPPVVASAPPPVVEAPPVAAPISAPVAAVPAVTPAPRATPPVERSAPPVAAKAEPLAEPIPVSLAEFAATPAAAPTPTPAAAPAVVAPAEPPTPVAAPPARAVAPPPAPEIPTAVAASVDVVDLPPITHAEMAAANLFATDEAVDVPAEAADVVPELAVEAPVPAQPTPAAVAPTPQVPRVEAPPARPTVVAAPAAAAAPLQDASVAPSAPVPPVVVAPAPVATPRAVAAVPEAAAPVADVVAVLPTPAAPVAAEPPKSPATPPAEPTVPEPAASRFDATHLPDGWVTPPAPRFDSHPLESSRYGSEPHPVLPGLVSELEAIERESAGSDTLPAVVLSLTRDGARGGGGSLRGAVRPGGIERLLRLAAARGASALYLTTQARPAVRVDGDIRLLDGESPLSSGDVEAAVLELAPEGARDKESAEWIRDLADVGRVRITTFRDYRGPGALLRMIQARATSAEQLGLVREIQALATEPEGLVIVTGPRASGKSTLVAAFVDLLNRQRNDYVITLEGQIRLVHESRGSLISQRELRGSAPEIVSAARAALRENPDVLVIEDLRSPDVLQVALDAAGSGLLVFVSVTAASSTAALERLVDLCPSDQRRTVRAALAEHLRGVVAQVLLRKAGGGRLAARELVLNTSAVAALVSDGQIAQLPRAIDSGRKLGMAPLNDALVAFVQSGAVDVREAYRKADDKPGLLALLRREGIDTSFVERLA